MTDPNKIFSKEESCLPLNVMMDYIHDRLSNKERNYVERHMLQCEFCNEAMDGLSLVDETKGKEIIESIDKTNLLEDQILYAASLDESNLVEDSTVEYELAPASMAAMSSNEKRRKSESVGRTFVLKESKETKSFDWRRIAASITLILFACGGLYYLINHNTNPANTNIVLSEKEKSEEPIKEQEVTDSVIAIAPQVLGNAIESKPNSDAVLNKQEISRTFAATEVKADEKVKDEVLQEEELITPEVANDRAMMAAPAKGEVKEEPKLLDAEVAKQGEDKKLDSYAMKSVGTSVAKAKKAEPRVYSLTESVADTTSVSVEKSINSDFDKGLNLYMKGEYQKSTKYFEKISKTDVKYEEARWYLAKSYQAVGEKGKANTIFNDIVAMNGSFKARAEEELKKLE